MKSGFTKILLWTSKCKLTTFHSSIEECYLKVRAINNLIDNRSNKSNASNKLTESAKSRAWCARALGVLTCLASLRAWCAYVLVCSRAWHAYVLTCLACLCAYVLTCLCAWCAYMCKCVLVCLIYFAFQYLNLKILTAKTCVLC